eukprot:11324531-Heterocapsa_arctica.AAC.1
MAAFRTHGLAPLQVDRLVLARNLALDLLVLALDLLVLALRFALRLRLRKVRVVGHPLVVVVVVVLDLI